MTRTRIFKNPVIRSEGRWNMTFIGGGKRISRLASLRMTELGKGSDGCAREFFVPARRFE